MGAQGTAMPDVSEPGLRPSAVPVARVGWGFIALYTAAYLSTVLVLLAPLLVTLALKINALVGPEHGPDRLAVVAAVGALVAMVGNPLVGRMSDRTTSRWGRRRPWIVVGLLGGSAGTLVVALAPTVPVVLVGWCIAQLFFNALLASMVAVLPDQVPVAQRGVVAGALGVCLPAATVCGTLIVTLFAGDPLVMFMAPCVLGGIVILIFAATVDDRPLPRSERPAWSFGEFVRTFYVGPRTSPDFAWAFVSRFLFVLAYAFLTTYEAYYLLDRMGSAATDVPHQIFLGALTQSGVVVVASLIGGRLSDRSGRRKVFVFGAAVVYGAAMFVLAVATGFDGFLVGMALSGLGLGVYVAVDLALVVDVLPGTGTVAKDLGVFNIAGALPYSIAPAIAPVILTIGGYTALYSVAGASAVGGAIAILFLKRVR